MSRLALRAVAATVAVAASATTSLWSATPAAASGPPGEVVYRPPVEAVVIDGFRPPPEPWLAGNRGIDYATPDGATVRAAAGGRVTFAGPVGGALHVVVLHDDGIRTSYSFLATIAVRRGQHVEPGQAVGTAAAALHFGARLGDRYLDPAGLFGGRVRVRLVPEALGSGAGGGGERSHLERLVRSLAGSARAGAAAAARLAGGVGAAAADVSNAALALAAHAQSVAVTATPDALVVSVSRAATEWWGRRGECTPRSVRPPPVAGRRLLVRIAGLGSSAPGAGGDVRGAVADVDPASLGYRADDVVSFSYAGRGDAADEPYRAQDTQVDIRESARRLRRLLEDLRVEHPAVPVDIVAHSQGGLVARTFLVDEYDRFDPRLPRLNAVVTLGTPHSGAPLASLARGLAGGAPGRVAAALGTPLRVGSIELGRPSVRQMAEGSRWLRALGRRPLPSDVRVTSIAARGDVVVPSGSSRLPGATNVVVAVGGVGQHGRLPGSAAAHREVALAVAGAPPTCEGLLDALADAATGHVIATAERVASLGVAGSGLGFEGGRP